MPRKPPIGALAVTGDDIHVVPTSGEHKASPECWCCPRVEDGQPSAQGGRIWVHNVVEPARCVVGLRATTCAAGQKQHASSVLIGDDSELDAADLIALIEAGRQYFMVPPEGSSAHDAYIKTGLPLIIQVVQCPDCGVRVLFA